MNSNANVKKDGLVILVATTSTTAKETYAGMVEPVFRSTMDTFVSVELHSVADTVSCLSENVIEDLVTMAVFVLICPMITIAHASMAGEGRLVIQDLTIAIARHVCTEEIVQTSETPSNVSVLKDS